MKILVVDDEREFVSLLIEALSDKHEVVGITGGKDLVDWFKHNRFDLVLLDIRPDGSGLELVGKLKTAYPHAFVILMTGTIPGLTRNQAIAAGADDFMAKPLDIRRLRKAIEDLQGPDTKAS